MEGMFKICGTDWICSRECDLSVHSSLLVLSFATNAVAGINVFINIVQQF